MTPKQRADIRKHNWKRVLVICFMSDQGHQPSSVDLWFARKFLRGVVADPKVVGPFGGTIDEGPNARLLLWYLDDKHPEPQESDFPDRRLPKVKYKRRPITGPTAIPVEINWDTIDYDGPIKARRWKFCVKSRNRRNMQSMGMKQANKLDKELYRKETQQIVEFYKRAFHAIRCKPRTVNQLASSLGQPVDKVREWAESQVQRGKLAWNSHGKLSLV